MAYSNVDARLYQMESQLLFLLRQMINQPPDNISTGPFIGALEDFIEQIGAEIEKQSK